MRNRKYRKLAAALGMLLAVHTITGNVLPEMSGISAQIRTVQAQESEQLLIETEEMTAPVSQSVETSDFEESGQNQPEFENLEVIWETAESVESEPQETVPDVTVEAGQNQEIDFVISVEPQENIEDTGNGEDNSVENGTASTESETAADSETTPDSESQTEGESGADSSLPTESETQATESETEISTGEWLETELPGTDSTEPETETDSVHQEEPEKPVYLGIDNRHLYKGMEQSFSDGYQPKVENGTVYLTVPFTASGALQGDCMTVDLAFAETQDSPFVFRNYQKDVKRKLYREKDGTMVKLTDAEMQEYEKQSVTGGTDSGLGDADKQTNHEDKNTAGSYHTDGIQTSYVYTCEIPLQSTAAPGQYSVTVKAWGYTKQGAKVTLDYQVFVQIPEPEPQEQPKEPVKHSGGSGGGFSGGGGGGGTPAEEIIRQPKMLLSKCSLSGKALEAGKQENLQADFTNRSASQAMYNLKVTAAADGTSVQLAQNSFYFEKVAPGETISLDSALQVAPDAASGVVPLNFSFEYEDKKGNAASGHETMALTVAQPVRMELETSEVPHVLFAADTVELPVKALNLSRTGVYNVRVNLSGTGLFPTEDVFIGNMEAGSEGDGRLRIYVGTRTMEAIGQDSGTADEEKYGPVSGTITLKYEDAFGTTHELTQEYQSEIKKAQILSLKVDEEEPEANPWWMSVFAVTVAALAVVILILLGRLRRKNVLLKEAQDTFK